MIGVGEMVGSIKNIWLTIRQARKYSVSMHRKLALYWCCMALAIFGGAISLLSIAGVIPGSERSLGEALSIQQQNTATMLSTQMDILTARSIALSGEITRELDNILIAEDKAFDDLNDNAALISEVEDSLYNVLETVLKSNSCSGAFFLLDATVNTGTENADSSRMGVYLRFSDLKAVGAADQHIVYFRGAADVARKKQVQMHNRWNLEYDTSSIPGYDSLMEFSGTRLAEGVLWTERVQLKDTWEDALLLCVPILDGKGRVLGICGVELSELYFSLSYPVTDSPFGNMVAVLAPMESDHVFLEKAMIGNSAGTYLMPEGIMEMRKGKYYQNCVAGNYRYFGACQPLAVKTASGLPLTVMTLISENSYWQASLTRRQLWVLGSLGFLVVIVLLSVFLSKHFVSPIVQSLKAMQEDGIGEHRSGISEIDALITFVNSHKNQMLAPGDLPPDIEELLRDFAKRVQGLTPTEKTVLRLFIEGCDINEVAEQLYISIGTARKHNTNLNRKLGVSNREELMVYIDLFRRCDRLEELTRTD